MTNNPTIDGVSVPRQNHVAEVEREFDNDCGHVHLLQDLPDGTKLYEAPHEVAAMQSTIAQLQARIAELESGRGEPVGYGTFRNGQYGSWLFRTEPSARVHLRTANNGYPMEAEVHALFTAPPAPVAQQLDQPTAYLRNEGVPNNLVVCGFDHPDAFKVFKAPQGPVAVVLPELGDTAENHMRWLLGKVVNPGDYPVNVLHDQIRSTLSCLDATAALNEVRK
jgi:hypothetical protein